MDKNYCQMLFNTNTINSEEMVKHNNESLFTPFNYNNNYSGEDDGFSLNFCDQLLANTNSPERDFSSDWESDASEETEDDSGDDLHHIQLQTSAHILESNEINNLTNFCQHLPQLLPKFCDFEQCEPEVSDEIIATENEALNMDLLTCTAATANCYRDNCKVSIKSKYGKWGCSGRSNPDIGLGPLSQLFIDNYVNNYAVFATNANKSQQIQSSSQIQTQDTDMSVISTFDHNCKTGSQFNSKSVSNEFTHNYSQQMYYNQQNQYMNPSNNDHQNTYHFNNNNYTEKYCPSGMSSQYPMYESNQWNQNHCYNYNNSINHNNYETNVIQHFYCQ